MTPMQKRSAAAALAVAIAAPAEGLRQWAYYDPVGILTTCMGHTGPDVVKGKKYSLAECDAFLTDDMREAIQIVDQCVPGLPVEMLAGFGDAVFNSGPKIACDTKSSTAARLLKAGNYVAACNQLPRWNKAKVLGVMVELPGLTIRRGKEQALCLQGATT